MNDEFILHKAMNIVNQLFDLTSLTVKERQGLNDNCNAVVIKILKEVIEKETLSNKNQLLKTLAEFENFKKRKNREIEEFKKRATEDLIKELLPALDSLDLAIDKKFNNDEGLSLVRKQFLSILSKFNIEKIHVDDKEFDHNIHEAIAVQDTFDKSDDNKIVEETNAGYKLNNILVRPVKVIVAKFKDQ